VQEGAAEGPSLATHVFARIKEQIGHYYPDALDGSGMDEAVELIRGAGERVGQCCDREHHINQQQPAGVGVSYHIVRQLVHEGKVDIS
jgi:hypothetical protein